jgi:uncharacterized repeat protein (TIGR01451 family)
MAAPAAVNEGSLVTFTMNVVNNGPANAAQVSLTDTLPAPLSSFATTLGTCAATGAVTLTCNLGPMTAGESATISITVLLPNATGVFTNTASITAFDATGAAINDPNPANNLASASVTSLLPVFTDIQVTGAAQNGGPNVGSADTYTWQVKDNQGTISAPDLVFTDTLPASLQFVSVSANLGVCTGPPAGSLGGQITCSAATLPGGQAMLVTIKVIVTQAGTLANTGSATFNGVDTQPANNSFTVTVNAK